MVSVMAIPDSGAQPTRNARRERLIALLVLGVAVILLVSSVTWFGTGRTAVGVGGVLYRRAAQAL